MMDLQVGATEGRANVGIEGMDFGTIAMLHGRHNSNQELSNSADEDIDAYSEVDSINEELSASAKITKNGANAKQSEVGDTLDLEVEVVELGGGEDIDEDEDDDDDDEDMLLGPNSFGAAVPSVSVAEKQSPVVLADKKPVNTAGKAVNNSLSYAGFDSWDDDNNSSLTNVTRSPTLMPGFPSNNTPQSRNGTNSGNPEINDSVMKLFQSTSNSSRPPSERPNQSKNDADADALKALIGLTPSANGDSSRANSASDKQVTTLVSSGDSQPLINIAGTSAPPTNTVVQQVDLTEVLTLLKSIQMNQVQLEKRLDKLTLTVAANQKEAKNVARDAIAANVKNEIQQQVVPAVKKIVQPMTDNLNNLVSQKLTSTDAVVKEQIKKIVASKPVGDAIGKQAATSVEAAVSQKCRELFEHKLAPQFSRAMEESVKQVGTVFQTGTGEYLRGLEAHGKMQGDKYQSQLEAHVNTVQKQLGSNQSDIQKIVKETVKAELGGVRAEVQQSVSGVGKQVVTEVQNGLAEHSRQLQNTLQGQLKIMQRQVAAATPVPEGSQQNHVDVRPMVEEELKKQNFDKAFEIALTAADVPLVLHVCETVGSNLEKPTFKISIPNVLALLQQLSCNLQSCNRVELRLYVLEQSLMKLDPMELCKYPKFDRSLSALERELTKFFQARGRSDPSFGKAKMLASAVRELAVETKQMVS